MVRTQAPLVERMTLVWHDWFATSKAGVDRRRLMLRQNALLRRHALGSFEQLAIEITRDPAMLLWLNGDVEPKDDVNENYARELQELFCLGAGRGYSERDVREMARALTGFRNDWSEGRGPHALPLRPRSCHDGGFKRIYGKRGRFDWQDGVRLVVAPPPAPRVPRREALGLLHPDAAAAGDGARAGADVRRLGPQTCGRCSRRSCATRTSTTRAAGWSSRRSCRPRACCARSAAGSTPTAWSWLCDGGRPDAVRCRRTCPGWDDTPLAGHRDLPRALADGGRDLRAGDRLDPEKRRQLAADPAKLVDQRRRVLGRTPLSRRHPRRRSSATPRDAMATANESWERDTYPVLTENALRMLVAASPDYLTS